MSLSIRFREPVYGNGTGPLRRAGGERDPRRCEPIPVMVQAGAR